MNPYAALIHAAEAVDHGRNSPDVDERFQLFDRLRKALNALPKDAESCVPVPADIAETCLFLLETNGYGPSTAKLRRILADASDQGETQ